MRRTTSCGLSLSFKHSALFPAPVRGQMKTPALRLRIAGFADAATEVRSNNSTIRAFSLSGKMVTSSRLHAPFGRHARSTVAANESQPACRRKRAAAGGAGPGRRYQLAAAASRCSRCSARQLPRGRTACSGVKVRYAGKGSQLYSLRSAPDPGGCNRVIITASHLGPVFSRQNGAVMAAPDNGDTCLPPPCQSFVRAL